jgi:hypothetical protein
MRFTLTTRHRRVLILTGDDIPVIDDDEDSETYVCIDSADLTPAPELGEDGSADSDSDYDRFGFGK